MPAELTNNISTPHKITGHHTASINTVPTMNEANAATRVPTSPSPACQPVAPPSRESVDIATTANVAYMATDINSSVNSTFIPLQSTSASASDSMYDYARP